MPTQEIKWTRNRVSGNYIGGGWVVQRDGNFWLIRRVDGERFTVVSTQLLAAFGRLPEVRRNNIDENLFVTLRDAKRFAAGLPVQYSRIVVEVLESIGNDERWQVNWRVDWRKEGF